MKKNNSSKSKTVKSLSSAKELPVHVDNNSSVQVREIKNGFIVAESGYTGKGRNQQWYNNEYYSASNPLKSVAGKIKFGGKK